MSHDTHCRDLVRSRQNPGGAFGDARAMGADIGALVVEELAIHGEDASVSIDGGTQAVLLLPRMVTRHQVLAPILDPFHRTSKP